MPKYDESWWNEEHEKRIRETAEKYFGVLIGVWESDPVSILPEVEEEAIRGLKQRALQYARIWHEEN